MAAIRCPHCLQLLELPLRDICPHCGRTLENGNPEGALPFATLLGGHYTVGAYLFSDGDGLCYQGVENTQARFVRIKEFFPVTLCNGRSRDGALLPKEGSEVLFKTSLMDFKDLYEDLKGLTPAEGLSQILDTVEQNNTVYAVEESYKGMTLTHYLSLRPRAMTPNEACEMLRPILQGVQVMHKAGLIHRGICPDNILLPIDGTARLTGYGTLALRTRGSELKSRLYPGYAAPEQYAAAEFAGRYTDVYALAAVIYRMVTNQKPMPAPQRKARDGLESAHSLESGVPVYFSQVLSCAMRMDTAKRMQTVQELERALQDPEMANAMFDDGQVSTKKLLGALLAGVFVVVALLLWGLLSTSDGGTAAASPAPSASPAATDAGAYADQAGATELVPNLVGKNYQTEVMNDAGLNAAYRISVTEEYSDTVAQGLVIRQEPMAGSIRQDGQLLELTVSLGVRLITMPDVLGDTREEAEELLRQNGIKCTWRTDDRPNEEAQSGTVTATSVIAGTQFDPEQVTVLVTLAP